MHREEMMLVLAQAIRDLRHRVLIRLRRLALVAIALLAISAAIGVAAAAACNPGRTASNYTFGDGWDTGPSFDGGHCIDGSQATITVKNPYVDAGNGSDPNVTAWTALIDPITSEIGQIGWGNTTPNPTRYNFAEFAAGNTIHDLKTWTANPVDTAQSYKVTYSSGYFHLFENGTLYYDFSDTSYVGCWAQQGGETHNWNSQMPGVSSGHDTFANVEIRHSQDESWYTTNSWKNSGAEGLCPSPFILDTYPGDPCSGSGHFNLTPGVHMDNNIYSNPYFLDIWDKCT